MTHKDDTKARLEIAQEISAGLKKYVGKTFTKALRDEISDDLTQTIQKVIAKYPGVDIAVPAYLAKRDAQDHSRINFEPLNDSARWLDALLSVIPSNEPN